MSTNFSDRILGRDTHANRPTAASVPEGATYSCSDHSKVYVARAGAWADWLVLGAPVVSSGDPLLYIDSLALHADGDDFDGPSLDAAWTLQGVTSGALSFETTREYDSSVLVAAWPSGTGQVIHRAKPATTDFTLYLTCHGISSDSGMPGLCITDNSGNGIGFSPYTGGSSYMWGLTGWAYASSGNSVGGVPWRYGTSNVPYVLRLVKSGTSYTGSFSSDGGVSWLSPAAQVNATTMTRVGFGKFFTGTPTQKIGRFNVA